MKIILFDHENASIMHVSSLGHIVGLIKNGAPRANITMRPITIGPVKLLLISNNSQEGMPNRIVGGRMIHGPFILCGRSKAGGPVDIPAQYTHWLRYIHDLSIVEAAT